MATVNEVSKVIPLLVSLDQAAEMLVVSRRSVERLISSGQLQAVRINSRSIRLQLRDVETFANSQGTAA